MYIVGELAVGTQFTVAGHGNTVFEVVGSARLGFLSECKVRVQCKTDRRGVVLPTTLDPLPVFTVSPHLPVTVTHLGVLSHEIKGGGWLRRHWGALGYVALLAGALALWHALS